MTATTLAPPRRRVQRVDMNARLATLATDRPTRDLLVVGMNAKHVASTRQLFGEGRAKWGLGTQVTDLTELVFPKQEKVYNAKIRKNELPTLSLTMNSHASTRLKLDDDRIVVLNTCQWAGACSAVCVLKHGRGKWDHVQAARNWRNEMLYRYPARFLGLLRHEILRAAKKVDGPFLARLNVNSDLPWHLFPALFADVPIMAYDYTKDPSVLEGDGWVVPGKYRKIYSWNETSDVGQVMSFLDRGGSVAVVTNRPKGREVRATIAFGFESYDVVDGDLTDDRFHTPPGVIVDLYAKGDARTKASPFVVRSY